MKKSKTNFWDFATDNPDIVLFLGVFGSAAIVLSVCAICGVFN